MDRPGTQRQAVLFIVNLVTDFELQLCHDNSLLFAACLLFYTEKFGEIGTDGGVMLMLLDKLLPRLRQILA